MRGGRAALNGVENGSDGFGGSFGFFLLWKVRESLSWNKTNSMHVNAFAKLGAYSDQTFILYTNAPPVVVDLLAFDFA
jgi:hypothetical protein